MIVFAYRHQQMAIGRDENPCKLRIGPQLVARRDDLASEGAADGGAVKRQVPRRRKKLGPMHAAVARLKERHAPDVHR